MDDSALIMKLRAKQLPFNIVLFDATGFVNAVFSEYYFPLKMELLGVIITVSANIDDKNIKNSLYLHYYTGCPWIFHINFDSMFYELKWKKVFKRFIKKL